MSLEAQLGQQRACSHSQQEQEKRCRWTQVALVFECWNQAGHWEHLCSQLALASEWKDQLKELELVHQVLGQLNSWEAHSSPQASFQAFAQAFLLISPQAFSQAFGQAFPRLLLQAFSQIFAQAFCLAFALTFNQTFALISILASNQAFIQASEQAFPLAFEKAFHLASDQSFHLASEQAFPLASSQPSALAFPLTSSQASTRAFEYC